jgi:CRP-like cAMP-binding protein
MAFRLVPRRDRKLNRLVRAGRSVELKRGERLYEPGDTAGDAFLVREGHVRLWLDGDRGDRPGRTVAVAGPRELFGLEAAISGPGLRRRYGAIAGERCLVVALHGARVARALRTAEKTFASVLRAAEEDLAAARRHGAGRAGPSTPERLADVLLDLVDRFGVDAGQGKRIPLSLTHQELADLCGAHRSTVTTLLNDWIYRRALRDSGSGLQVDSDRLRRLASPR